MDWIKEIFLLEMVQMRCLRLVLWVVFPEVTYSFYPVYANLFQIPYKTVALHDGFTLHAEDLDGAEGGVIFPNPNAPTGVYLPLEQVEQIVLENSNKVVIIDEAYID